MKKIFDLPYSNEYVDRRLVDFFIPDSNLNGGCILFIHGGGWYAGNKAAWHKNAEYFCNKKLLDHGCQSRLEILPKANHGFGYGISTEAQIKSIEFMEEFLINYLK